MSGRARHSTSSPPGTSRWASTSRPCGTRSLCRTSSTGAARYQRDDRYQHGPGGPAGQSGPAGQYARPDYDLPQRDEHYASFAEQDAAYTRPRPPGARDQFSPQDDTDPLNIVPLNTGNYS